MKELLARPWRVLKTFIISLPPNTPHNTKRNRFPHNSTPCTKKERIYHTRLVSPKMMDVVLHALNIFMYFLHITLHPLNPILMGCHQWWSHMETKGTMPPPKKKFKKNMKMYSKFIESLKLDGGNIAWIRVSKKVSTILPINCPLSTLVYLYILCLHDHNRV